MNNFCLKYNVLLFVSITLQEQFASHYYLPNKLVFQE